MTHTLSSDTLSITVSNQGAELQSILCQKTNTQYLWQGGPGWWGGRAPVLFPVVCALKDNAFTHQGRHYTLAKHGFVRQAYFYGKHTPNELVFEYVDNPQTRLTYPFAFTFRVAFSVADSTVTVKNLVTNESGETMYFSVGAHEAYNCPINENVRFDDYYLEFERHEPLDSLAVNPQSGVLSGGIFPVKLEGGILPLRHSLFDRDALIFKDLQSKSITLKCRKHDAVVQVAYDAPHMGIWQLPGAPYLCIEPWWGLPDYDHSNGVLAQKDGIVKLDAGETFVSTHTIRVSGTYR